MKTRNGKIARLPRFVRDELNQRLERAEESPQLLAWLNALPEVKEVVQDDFAGIPISKQNLSQWRQGGFQEWLARQELWEHAQNTRNFADDLSGEEDHLLVDDVATVLAARYAALLDKWDGEVDQQFDAKTRVLNRLCRSVVQLQRSMHWADRQNEDSIRRQEEDDEQLQKSQRQKLMGLVLGSLHEPELAKILGGGKAGEGLARIITQLQHDLPLDDKDVKKPVKPSKTKKTSAKKSANPLQESKMGAGTKQKSSPSQSELVKAGLPSVATAAKEGQTNLAPKEDSDISPMSPLSPISPIIAASATTETAMAGK